MRPSFFASFLRAARSGGRRSPDECVRLCAEAGFEEIDYSPDFSGEGWLEETEGAAKASARYSIKISQCHAPFNFYKKEALERFTELLDRAAEGAKILGVQNLVFHFDEYHPPKGTCFDSSAALKNAYEVLAPAIEKTLSFGINAALENTFEDHYRVGADERSHLCSEISELEAALDMFNDPCVTCCWDFGHAHLQFGDRQAEMLRRIGKRISCTHVHDNYYGKDLHLLPFYGQVDWETLIPTLSACGYTGPLAFEAGYGRFPDELIPEFMRLSRHAMGILCSYA
ncbi:MAG: sugar phosphate isomerase/epimerase [Clostridiales bacterium]|nr:sugar phosphate isomerase/epimerase [Clostridiales bacterium]